MAAREKLSTSVCRAKHRPYLQVNIYTGHQRLPRHRPFGNFEPFGAPVRRGDSDRKFKSFSFLFCRGPALPIGGQIYCSRDRGYVKKYVRQPELHFRVVGKEHDATDNWYGLSPQV